VSALALVAVLACAPQAVADHPPAQDYSEPLPASVKRVTGPDTVATKDGLLKVQPETGPPVITHGPDPKAELALSASALPGEVGFRPGDEERAPVCSSGPVMQVLYARPAGAPDRLETMRPEIQAAVRRMNAVLNSESLASGGPTADYRVRCEPDGEILVGSFEAAGASFGQIVSSGRRAGFSDQANFLVFYDGNNGGACGIGSFRRDDDRLKNVSNTGGGYGVVYDGCWFGEAAMHENAHNMGAVQYDAPNSTGNGGHCFEEADVMCYSPDGGDLNQSGTVERCPGAARFDCGFDDYFDTAPETGEYLDGHWNVGSPLNRYISLGESTGPMLRRGKAGSEGSTVGEPGAWRVFDVVVPSRTKRLTVRLQQPANADLSLYLRRQKLATEAQNTCSGTPRHRPAGEGRIDVGTIVTCQVRNPRRGKWFASVLTRSGQQDTGYVVKAGVSRRHRGNGHR
jgi:hypothetical protein